MSDRILLFAKLLKKDLSIDATEEWIIKSLSDALAKTELRIVEYSRVGKTKQSEDEPRQEGVGAKEAAGEDLRQVHGGAAAPPIDTVEEDGDAEGRAPGREEGQVRLGNADPSLPGTQGGGS